MLTLAHVRKRYGARVALHDLSLELRRGEVLGLLGPNGAGKSTLVRLVVGLCAPDRGEVRVDAVSGPGDPETRARIGLAPQELALYERLTGAENLRYFASLYGLTGAELARRIDEILALVGLQERRDDRVATYSGGMRRRLNLGVALVHGPELLVLDEPTAGVDPQARLGLLDLVARLRGEGLAVLLATHHLEVAAQICDRVAILDRGHLLALDTVDGLVAAHGGPRTLRAEIDGRHRHVEVADPRDALATLRAWAQDGELGAFHLEGPGLEAVFVALTGRAWRD